MNKKPILEIIILALFMCISLTVNAGEYVYKTLTLDIPDGEVTGGGIANIEPYDSLLLRGEGWYMGFDNYLFMKNCLSLSEKLGNILSCEEKNRIALLDNAIAENSIIAQVFFLSEPHDKIKRQEFEYYILYSSVGPNKREAAMLVEKLTGKTTHIGGRFSDKHLKWLRLIPLSSPAP
ncbi:hypothetical protein MNBD_GAMMA03-138 [hydrothermal vent metagenome]|uniref:Uncharacterized protein n=1 Tax=hydrothermal vent metagenome TaxID=652676 RepID=A0A3B0WY68_9ZZZZ